MSSQTIKYGTFKMGTVIGEVDHSKRIKYEPCESDFTFPSEQEKQSDVISSELPQKGSNEIKVSSKRETLSHHENDSFQTQDSSDCKETVPWFLNCTSSFFENSKSHSSCQTKTATIGSMIKGDQKPELIGDSDDIMNFLTPVDDDGQCNDEKKPNVDMKCLQRSVHKRSDTSSNARALSNAGTGTAFQIKIKTESEIDFPSELQSNVERNLQFNNKCCSEAVDGQSDKSSNDVLPSNERGLTLPKIEVKTEVNDDFPLESTSKKSHSGKRCPKRKRKSNRKRTNLLKDSRRRKILQKDFVCNEEGCGRAYSSIGNLRRHQIIHSDYNPFTCQYCGRALQTMADLKRHLCIHSGERPFVCNSCGKGFIFKSGLRNHTCGHGFNITYHLSDYGDP